MKVIIKDHWESVCVLLETVKMGREKHQKLEVKELQEPYPVKFTKEHRKEKSHWFQIHRMHFAEL